MELTNKVDPVRTYEERVWALMPRKYRARALAKIAGQMGLKPRTILTIYLKGRYSSPIIREYFRELLRNTVLHYLDVAREEIRQMPEL